MNRLHLGCGSNILPDHVNLDIVHLPGVDVVCDVRDGLPFADDVFASVLAVDFIEHVPPPKVIALMNDVYRVLENGGRFRIHVPEAPGITAVQDPTHVSFWNEETFSYFTADAPRRRRYGVTYGIVASFRVVSVRRRRHLWRRFLSTGNINYLTNYLLDVELEAVKTGQPAADGRKRGDRCGRTLEFAAGCLDDPPLPVCAASGHEPRRLCQPGIPG